MIAGDLTESIVIQKLNITRSEFGANHSEWVDQIATRAKVRFNKGNRDVVNDEIFHAENVIFTIRIYHKVLTTDRIKWDDKLYRILSINKDKQDQCQIIVGELINE